MLTTDQLGEIRKMCEVEIHGGRIYFSDIAKLLDHIEELTTVWKPLSDEFDEITRLAEEIRRIKEQVSSQEATDPA